MPWVSEEMFSTGWDISRTSGRDKCESSDVISTTDTPCSTKSTLIPPPILYFMLLFLMIFR